MADITFDGHLPTGMTNAQQEQLAVDVGFKPLYPYVLAHRWQTTVIGRDDLLREVALWVALCRSRQKLNILG